MKKEKSNKGLYVIIGFLCLLVLALGGYIVYDKVLSNDSNKQKNEQTNNVVDNKNTDNKGSETVVDDNTNNETVVNDNSNNTNTVQEPTINYFYNVKDLNVKALSEYRVFADLSNKSNVIEEVYFGYNRDYGAALDLSGNVIVKKYNKSDVKGITGNLNISNVIDIVNFDIPSNEADQLLYLLTDSGNLYYYRIGDIENNSFNATKVDSISNVKKIFISRYAKENAGGSWALFAITGNNDCIMINGGSV